MRLHITFSHSYAVLRRARRVPFVRPADASTSDGSLPSMADGAPHVAGVQLPRRSVLNAAGGLGLAALAAAWGAPATRGAAPRPAAKVASPAVATTPSAVLTTVAVWPIGSFLENVAVRADGSMLVTELNRKQLWFVPAPATGTLVQPVLIHTFDQPPFDIQEATRDVFYVDTATFLTTHESFLQRVDLRHWAPGMPVPVDQALQFPAPASSANGSCLLAPDVMLVADSAGLIWRVDLSDDGRTATARVWLQDPSMNPGPPVVPPQPGINGIEYGKMAGFVYYTSTFQELFMRVPVDPETFNPAGAPELIATGSLWDDFDIDEKAGAAYITTHRQNTLQRVPLDPHSGQAIQTIAGQPFDPQLAGPSDFAWGPGPQDVGSVAFLTTDGGVTAPPPDGIIRPAKLLRVDLPGS